MNTAAGSLAALPLVPTDEEMSIRESVRGICAQFGDRYGRECYERGEPPLEAWNALAEKGFVGINIPQEWGGGGMGMSGLIVVAEEVTAAGIPTLMLVVSSAIAGSILARHGTDEQNDRWLRGVAAGTTRLAFGITEPDAGTNSHNLRTDLRKDGDRYLLNGQKVFISAVEDAAAVLVVARFRGDDGQLGMPCLCIVDVDAPGLPARRDPDALHRARQAVDAVLRRRGRRGRPPHRRRDGRAGRRVRRAQPGADHRRGDRLRHRPPRARQGRRPTRASARCGTRRSARTRPSRTRSPRRRSRSSWPS